MEDELGTTCYVCPVILSAKYTTADLILILRALTRITSDVEKYHRKSKRALAILDPRSYKSAGGAIEDLRKELDQALAAFQVSTLY